MVVKPGIGTEDWGPVLNAALDSLQADADTAQSTASTASTDATAAVNTATSAAGAASAAQSLADELDTQINASGTGLAAKVTDLQTIVGSGGSILERPWEIRPSSTSDADVQTAITTALNNASGSNAQRRVVLPPGSYNLTTPLLKPDGTPGSLNQLNGFSIEGSGIGTTTLNWNNAGSPMLNISDPRMRFVKFRNMTIASQNSGNVFAYFFSQQGGQFNNRFHFSDLRFSGNWTRGIGLDGGTDGNLNSEMTFERVETDPSSTWSDAFFLSGVTNDPSETQFLNYWFYDCNFSLTSGTVFRIRRGGSMTFINGSWSAAGAGSPAITWLDFPNPQSNQPDRNQVKLTRIRFEPKNGDHKILSSNMADGLIEFDHCSDNASSQIAGSYDHERYTITANSQWGGRVAPIVRFTGGSHGGYINYVASGGVQTRGGVIVDGCKWYRGDLGEKADEIQGGTQPILRWGGSAPNYDFRTGWNYDETKSWTVA